MKIPVNLLLYTASLGMLAEAGWLFYQATPNLGAEPLKTYIDKGMTEAQELVRRGQGTGRQERRYPYHLQDWWTQFRDFNCINKEPEKPPEVPVTTQVEPQPTVIETPLGDIADLVYVMFDSSEDAEKSVTSVILKYKPDANVEIPEALLGSVGSGGPGDSLPPARPSNGVPLKGGRPAASQLPTFGQREILHTLKLGEPLWKPYSHIRLARVAEDAESAYFVRTRPSDPPEAEPEEEELFKAAMGMSQELLEAIADLQRGQRSVQAQQQTESVGNSNWVDVDETRMVNGQYHISLKDQEMFRTDTDRLLERVNMVPYEPKFGGDSLRGLRVANVDPALANRFGVQQGDVILALNDVPVRTKAEAINVGKKLYNRGVRTFRVKMMSAGQIIERVYQAPDE